MSKKHLHASVKNARKLRKTYPSPLPGGRRIGVGWEAAEAELRARSEPEEPVEAAGASAGAESGEGAGSMGAHQGAVGATIEAALGAVGAAVEARGEDNLPVARLLGIARQLRLIAKQIAPYQI